MPAPGNSFPGWRHIAVRSVARAGMRVYLGALRMAGLRQRSRRDLGTGRDVLITAQYASAGWGRALLGPLAASAQCRRLRVVATAPDPGVDGLEVVQPPRWLRTVCGATAARLITFVCVAVRTRADVVGGVHLLPNGLVAALAARLSGARALYINVGGESEIAGGGIRSENRLAGQLAVPDDVLEHRLLQAVHAFDLIVTMGSSARAFFNARVPVRCEVIPGGVAVSSGWSADLTRDLDLIVVARLVPIKRIDLFLQVVRLAANEIPSLRAVVIGDGPLRTELEALVANLSLTAHLTVRSGEPDVTPWLRRSKLFVLTSETEGVSISMIEAMASGAVPVVANVGDLADAVTDAVNGTLVNSRSPAAFAQAATRLLRDPKRLTEMSAAARDAAMQFDRRALAQRWDNALTPVAAPNARDWRNEREQWAEEYS